MSRARRPSRSHRLSGFTLWEVLFALILLGTVGLVSMRGFVLSLKTTQKAEAAHAMMAQWEQMTRLLRQDMWAAETWTVTSERSVSIRHAGGSSITWTVEEDGSISRHASRASKSEEHHWTRLERSIRFATDGPQLLLTASDPAAPADRRIEQLRLAPALKLLEAQP